MGCAIRASTPAPQLQRGCWWLRNASERACRMMIAARWERAGLEVIIMGLRSESAGLDEDDG